jgi:hypothetical protein
MPAITSAASRRFGIAFGETNDVTSIFASPVFDNASINRILSAVGTKRSSLWKPSRTATSWMWSRRGALASDDTIRSQGFLFVRIDADRLEDLGCVFAERGAEPARAAGRGGQLRHDARQVDR